MNRITCRRRTPSKRELLEFHAKLVDEAIATKEFTLEIIDIEPSYEDAYIVTYDTELCKVSVVRGGTLIQVAWKDSKEVDYLEAGEAFGIVQCLVRGLSVIGESRV